MPPIRIVSLIASATEVLCALGLEEQLVGRSHECDYPPSVKRLPICTEPKFDPSGSSLEIHERVKAFYAQGSSVSVATKADASEEALSVYRIHRRELEELKPDVIVTQAQCEVCAVSLKDVERAVAEITGSQPKIISLSPNRLADVFQDIEQVAQLLGVFERGRGLVQRLRKRVEAIQTKSKGLRKRPFVALIEWIEPLMAVGNWMPELVSLAGGENLFGQTGKHSPWMSWEDLVKKNPDIIVVAPCGFNIDRSEMDMHFLTNRPEWSALRAVRNDKVFIVDGNQYFNRPGPRLVDSLEILAEIFHPDLFHFGYERKGWIRF